MCGLRGQRLLDQLLLLELDARLQQPGLLELLLDQPDGADDELGMRGPDARQLGAPCVVPVSRTVHGVSSAPRETCPVVWE